MYTLLRGQLFVPRGEGAQIKSRIVLIRWEWVFESKSMYAGGSLWWKYMLMGLFWGKFTRFIICIIHISTPVVWAFWIGEGVAEERIFKKGISRKRGLAIVPSLHTYGGSDFYWGVMWGLAEINLVKLLKWHFYFWSKMCSAPQSKFWVVRIQIDLKFQFEEPDSFFITFYWFWNFFRPLP